MNRAPRRPRLRWLAAAVTLLVAGCAAPGGTQSPAGPPGLEGQPAGPGVTARDEAAPSVTLKNLSVRADEVTRRGATVALGLTVGVAEDDFTLWSNSIEVATNSGVKIPATFTDRRISGNSAAALALSIPLPEASTTSLDVRIGYGGPQLTIPLPGQDATWLWRPAPLRQVGLAPVVNRNEGVEFIFETVRSEGMVTEVTYRGQGLGGRRPSFCSYSFEAHSCAITEADGTVHPLLSREYRELAANQRFSGTLRFLGELNRDATDIKITGRGGSAESDPQAVTLPTHANSPAVAAAGDLTRTAADIKPVTMSGSAKGAKLVIDRVSVLSDQVQVHLRGTGGAQDVTLIRSAFWTTDGDATEPGGFAHVALPPADTGVTLPKKGGLDATVVFQGSVPADVNALTLHFIPEYEGRLSAKIQLPAADKVTPPTGPTLAEVESSTAPGAFSPTATPLEPTPAASGSASPSAAPTTAVLTGAGIRPLPMTTLADMGVVRTTVAGVDSGSDVASGADVSARADADAQRSLEDLGAKKTPDGWVLTLPETVLFDYNKADLLPGSSAQLAKVAKLLAYYDKAKIGVQGYTDNVGGADYNIDLSTRRAQAVASALTADGVASGRMTVKGYGETHPVASNGTDEGRAKNRRVEIVLREQG